MITVRADVGGGPKHVYDLCCGIKEFVNIHIASPNEEPYFSRFQSLATSVFEIPHRRFSLLKFLSLLKFCREKNIDLVHSHGRGAGIYSRLLVLFGVRVVHTFHGAHVENSFKGYVKSFADRFLSPLALRYICVSNDERLEVCNLGWTESIKATVIHNGVNQAELSRIYSESNQAELRAKYNLPLRKKIWGTLARLTYQKGLDQFILYIAKNRESFDDYFFIVAGTGEDSDKLKYQLEQAGLQNILFIGQTDSPAQFLKILDGYFSFARWEGFPLSVIEGLAVGLPCVVSNVTGHRDFGDSVTMFNDDFLSALKCAKKPTNFDYTLEKMTNETYQLYKSLSEK